LFQKEKNENESKEVNPSKRKELMNMIERRRKHAI
jgi:hypothetical protein